MGPVAWQTCLFQIIKITREKMLPRWDCQVKRAQDVGRGLGGGFLRLCVCDCLWLCVCVKLSVTPAAVFCHSERCLTSLSRAAVLCSLGGSQVNTDVQPAWQPSARHTNQITPSANIGAPRLTLKSLKDCCRYCDFFTKAHIADVRRGFCECFIPLSNCTRPSACVSLLSNDLR